MLNVKVTDDQRTECLLDSHASKRMLLLSPAVVVDILCPIFLIIHYCSCEYKYQVSPLSIETAFCFILSNPNQNRERISCNRDPTHYR